ncbi:hypothetical protein [Luteimonas sp. A482]
MTDRTRTTSSNGFAESLRSTWAEAERAQPYRERHNSGIPAEYRHLGPDPQMIPANLQRGIFASMADVTLGRSFGEGGNLVRAPGAKPAGKSTTLDRAVIAQSRVASVGANVLVLRDTRKARAVGPTGNVVAEKNPAEFRSTEAAPFETVDIDTEAAVTVSDLPTSVARFEWDEAVAKSYCVEVSRRRLREIGEAHFFDQLEVALTLGLARCADSVLLAAINAAAPEGFTLARAASAGLKFDELRGVAGTAGTGATIAADGTLRVAGLPGELTGDMAGSLAGAWNRVAVAVRDDFEVIMQRTSVDGSMRITVWSHFLPLVPSVNTLWAVA